MNQSAAAGLGISLLALAAAMPAAAQDYAEAWQATGFDQPESVAYDPGTDTLFVSNINGGPADRDGNGYISRLGTDGEILTQIWVDGLNAPKGLEVVDGRLYVGDLGELVEIDIAAGTIANRYPAPESMFLNDVAAAPDGRVFVSDTGDNAIYVLEDDVFGLWLQDAALTGPNGLLVDGDRLVVASLGDLSQGFENLQPSNVKTVDLATMEVADLGSADPIGTLDGIEPDGQGGYLVTDNGGGRLVRVTADGAVEEVLALRPGAADHEVVQATGLVVVPLMQDGVVAAYRPGG